MAGEELVAMERMLTAFWDEDRQEVQVRRPTGQEFRFSARQAVAGRHEVFGVQTDGNDVLSQRFPAAHVESAVYADRHLPWNLGTLTGDIKWWGDHGH